MIKNHLISCIDDISKKNLPSFYLLDIDELLNNFQEFRKCWVSYFPKLKIAYSYKTNSIKFLTQIFQTLGTDAEVVSGMELEWALSDGFPPNNIFFDGPVKSEKELMVAIKKGVNIHVDSLPELETIIQISKKLTISPKISFRLSVEAGKYGISRYGFQGLSRFGFTREEYLQGLDIIKDTKYLLNGIHLHVGSNINEPTAYKDAILSVKNIIDLQVSQFGELSYFDVGGGFSASSAVMEQGIKKSLYSDFAKTIHDALLKLKINLNKTTIIVEPGRTLVEDFGFLIAAITSIKERNNKKLLIINEGSHLVKSAERVYHPVYFLNDYKEKALHTSKEHTVLGSNCYEMDLIGKNIFPQAPANVGDIVIIGSAGAYDIMPSNVWIRSDPPIFALYNHKILLIRKIKSSKNIRSNQMELINIKTKTT